MRVPAYALNTSPAIGQYLGRIPRISNPARPMRVHRERSSPGTHRLVPPTARVGKGRTTRCSNKAPLASAVPARAETRLGQR
jgi:hypothetical protein